MTFPNTQTTLCSARLNFSGPNSRGRFGQCVQDGLVFSFKYMMTNCCAECGKGDGVSLKICKPCMSVKYCNAECQRKHWPTHKKDCKRRVAELRDEALFKDPPVKEDCPICFLPLPVALICCISLPPATLSSIPIYDFSIANEALEKRAMETYCPCCGKSICRGCVHSFHMSENDKCPFCNYDHLKSSQEEKDEEIMKRVEANDPNAICVLAYQYDKGLGAFQQNRAKAMEL